MGAFCPNLNNRAVRKDFNQLQDIVGEDLAYYLWNKYEGEMSLALKEALDISSGIALLTTEEATEQQSLVDSVNKRRNHFTPQEWSLSNRVSTILRSLFPEISKEYVDSIEDGNIGKIDLDALKVMIDVSNEKIDTLSHEYAHYYIAMFRDSELVKEGIELFGSEEALVQAVGVRTVEMEGKARTWWLKLTDFIKNLLNNNKLYKQLLLAEVTDAFLTNREIGDRLSVTGIRYQSKDIDIPEVRNIIRTNQSTFTYDNTTHTYRSKSTGKELKAVSKYKEEMGYDNYDPANEDATQKEITLESQQNGTEIHSVFEHMWKGTFNASNHPKLSKLALDNIRKIVDSMKQDWDFVAAEVKIADEEHDIAGTTDLLLRNKKTGKYNLFDYKTKLFLYNGQKKNKRGGKLWGFTFVDSRRYSTKNQRDAYDFQLSAYQKMMEKLGILIEGRYIIPIVYSTTNGKIDNVFVSKMFGSIKELKSNYVKIEKNKQTIYDVDYKLFGDKKALGVDEETVDQAMFEITDLVRKVIDKLTIQKEILKLRRRRFTQERDASKALEEISSLSELDALLHYVNYAADQVSRLSKQITKRYKLGSKATWDLDVLQNYKELASSYDIVGRISGLAHRYADLFGSDNVNAIDTAVARLLTALNLIIEAYDSIGSNLYIEAITPYIGNKRYSMQQDARLDYIKKNPRKSGESSKEFEDRVQAYVDEYTREHEQEISYQTKEWLRAQQLTADSGFECSSIFATIGSVYESKDPFVQASVLLFDRRMNEKERKLILFKSKMQRILKEYRSKYSLGNFSNLREVFDDFVEVTEDGVSYLISPISSAYRAAEKKAIDEINENNELTYKLKLDAKKAWLDQHCPIYDVAKYEAELTLGMQEIMDPLTKEQKEVIKKNLSASKDKQESWYKLRKLGKLPDEAVESILELLYELEKKYRKPNIAMYPNKKYEAMMKLKESNDPKYQLYQLFVDAINDADVYMPTALKLNYRLPGIMKRGCELVGSDGLMAAFDRSISSDTIVMPDDAIRGTFIDENGDKLKLVPMFYHYSPKITKEDQSYDLPTIFFKWYDLALLYRFKKQIESVLLLTLAVLHTRKTSESRIKSLLRGKKDENIGSYKKNTANLYDKWLDQVLYGNRVSDMGTIKLPFTDKQIDVAKLIKSLISYSSNRTMSLNTVSGINNLLVGESNQLEEVLAGQFVDKESYARATKIFMMNVPSMLQDFNRVVPQNKVNQLAEWFGIFGSGDNMLISGFMRHSPLTYGHLTSRTGEEILQTRFLLAMLMKLDAKDENGNVIGKMYDFISFDENNQLVVDEKVANFTKEDLDIFSLKARRILIGLHGNYDKGRNPVAIDSKWYGWAGLSLRRWIEPNFERRFGSKGYDNLTDAIRGGFYNSGFGWVVATNPYSSALINFIARHCKVADEHLIKAVRWDELTKDDKQNVIRFGIEFGIAALAYSIFALLGGVDGDDDDPVLTNLRYLMYRLFTDLTFFTLPTSFSKILNDPFPVMGLMNDATNVFLQVFDIDAVYLTGKHLFDNKFLNQTFRLVPGFKQIGRLSNISSEMEVFMRLR